MKKVGMNATDIKLILVENYPCQNNKEAKARERFWIENDGYLNMVVPTRSFKERYSGDENFRNKILDRQRDYNRERMYERWHTDDEWRKKQLEKARQYKSRKEYREMKKQHDHKWHSVKVKCGECDLEMNQSSWSRHKKRCKGKLTDA